MKTPSFEHILFLILLIILLPLFRLLFQRVKRRYYGQHPQDEHRSEPAQRAQAIPLQPQDPQLFQRRLDGLQAPTVSTPLSRRESVARLTLGNKRGIRRGIILMAVVGPCRAFDPPSWSTKGEPPVA